LNDACDTPGLIFLLNVITRPLYSDDVE